VQLHGLLHAVAALPPMKGTVTLLGTSLVGSEFVKEIKRILPLQGTNPHSSVSQAVTNLTKQFHI